MTEPKYLIVQLEIVARTLEEAGWIALAGVTREAADTIAMLEAELRKEEERDE